jgi:hypothetical protein
MRKLKGIAVSAIVAIAASGFVFAGSAQASASPQHQQDAVSKMCKVPVPGIPCD